MSEELLRSFSKVWDKRKDTYLFIAIGNVEFSPEFAQKLSGKFSFNVSVRLEGVRGKTEVKTGDVSILVHGNVVVFNDILVLPIPEGTSESPDARIIFSVKNARKVIGTRSLLFSERSYPEISSNGIMNIYEGTAGEVVVEDKEEKPVCVGELNSGLYITNTKFFYEPPVLKELSESYNYFVSDLRDSLSPGDVILYNRSGPFSALYHCLYGTSATHCGIVLSPLDGCRSKTDPGELLVFEFGYNTEGFKNVNNDEIPHCAPGIYPLKECIENCAGTDIWYMKLREPLDAGKIMELTRWAVNRQQEFKKGGRESLDKSMFADFPLKDNFKSTLSNIGVPKKVSSSHLFELFADFYSANFVFLALRLMGLSPTSASKVVTIADILTSDYYTEPLILRMRKDHPLQMASLTSSTSSTSSCTTSLSEMCSSEDK